MYMTSSSLAYVFLGITILAFAFSLYFKTLVIRTKPNSYSRDKIIGNMKNPDAWRISNSRMGNFSLFWAILSLIVFIYLRFYYGIGLVNSVYVFGYLAVAIISAIFILSSLRSRKAK